jgi:O-antigen ligase
MDEPLTVKVAAGEVLRAGLDRAEAVVLGRPIRASGFYKHYVPFSELLVLIALLAWGLMLPAHGWTKGILAILFLLFTASMVSTVTRSAMAFLLLACLVVLWQVAGWKLRMASVALAIVALLLGSIWIQHRRKLGWVATADPGTQYRLVIWRDGLRLIARHPLVGVGFDNVVRHPDHWDIQAYRQFPLQSHFHSTIVEYAVDGGLLTLAAWLWLLTAYGWLLLSTARAVRGNAFAHGLALGLLGSLVAFFAMSLVHYTGGDAEVMTVFWFLMGLALALQQITSRDLAGFRPQTTHG